MNVIKYCFLLFVFIINVSIQAQHEDYFDAQPTIKAWMKERISNAKKGKREMVEFPMVVRPVWGARCPKHYMGVNTGTVEGPWIKPIAPKGFPVSKNDDKGHSLIVVGYFTGKHITEDLRYGEGQPESWVYTMPEFKIKSWRRNELDYKVGGPKVLK